MAAVSSPRSSSRPPPSPCSATGFHPRPGRAPSRPACLSHRSYRPRALARRPGARRRWPGAGRSAPGGDRPACAPDPADHPQAADHSPPPISGPRVAVAVPAAPVPPAPERLGLSEVLREADVVTLLSGRCRVGGDVRDDGAGRRALGYQQARAGYLRGPPVRASSSSERRPGGDEGGQRRPGARTPARRGVADPAGGRRRRASAAAHRRQRRRTPPGCPVMAAVRRPRRVPHQDGLPTVDRTLAHELATSCSGTTASRWPRRQGKQRIRQRRPDPLHAQPAHRMHGTRR